MLHEAISDDQTQRNGSPTDDRKSTRGIARDITTCHHAPSPQLRSATDVGRRLVQVIAILLSSIWPWPPAAAHSTRAGRVPPPSSGAPERRREASDRAARPAWPPEPPPLPHRPRARSS